MRRKSVPRFGLSWALFIRAEKSKKFWLGSLNQRPGPEPAKITPRKIDAMADKYMQLVLTPAVQQAQDKYFGKHQVVENAPATDPLTHSEAYFIASRDSFYMANRQRDRLDAREHSELVDQLAPESLRSKGLALKILPPPLRSRCVVRPEETLSRRNLRRLVLAVHFSIGMRSSKRYPQHAYSEG
jgi:hypothetical protein